MKGRNLAITVGVAVVAAVLGYLAGRTPAASDNADSTKPSAPVALEERQYDMNVVVAHVPFWTESRVMWQKLGEGVRHLRMRYGGPHSTDANEQITELEATLARGCNGLVLAPADASSIVPTIRKFLDADVPVITYLIDAPDAPRLTYITSELEQAGRRIAELAIAASARPGRVVISYAAAGNPEQEARARGIEQAIKAAPGYDVLLRVEDNYDEQRGEEVITAALAQHEDIVAIIGCNSRSAIGAIQALKSLDRSPGDVVVTGWDYDNDLIDLIEKGWIAGSVAQNSEFMTYLAYAILEGYQSGRIAAARGTPSGAAVPPTQITVPVELIDKNTARHYTRP